MKVFCYAGSLFKMLAVVFLFTSIFGCSSPASEAIKRGDGLLSATNYYGASQEYLSALGLEAGNNDAKLKLCQTAKQSYEQKLNIAASYEKMANFESALPQYRELSDLIDKYNFYNCLTFAPINVEQKIAEMQSGTSEKYYKEAEIDFANEDYRNAISNYKAALQYNSPYKDSKEKIAESYYMSAVKAEKKKNYREAAEQYLSSNDSISGYKDAGKKATSIYYSLGNSFLQKGLCRNAYDDLSQASKINGGFNDLSSKINEAEACAISKIAFMRFDNPTGRDISGMSIGDFIFDEIKSKLQYSASQFIRSIERNELFAVIDEQKLGAQGITDDYSTFKQLKGVDYLIFGKLTQVNISRPSPKRENMKTTGRQSYECTSYGKSGKPYKDYCTQDVTLYYKHYAEEIDLALSGSIKVVSVATGEQIIFYSISVKRDDSIEYADITSNINGNTSVPAELKSLSTARRELKDSDDLVKDMIDEISNAMVLQILDKIDKKENVSDPAELAMFQ